MTPRTTGRMVFAAAAVAALVGTQSCKKPEAEQCHTGIFCPAGWHCAASTAQCILGLCGNGRIDPLETCDDGGAADGDVRADGVRCSANCRSDESCGNTIIDTAVGEVCDPPGDDCSADCRTTLLCGNGVTNPPRETCDPGQNNVPRETEECNLDCTTTDCGDGKINRTAREDCDRYGDGIAGDNGQSPTCNADCTTSECGDGKTNPMATTPPGGERCDDGSTRNGYNANCLPTCIRNVCGDGHQNTTWENNRRVEDCDSGPSDADPRVDCPYNANQTSCTLCSVCKSVQGTPHYCGDGTTDSPQESCDQGSGNGATRCLYGNTSCQLCTRECRPQLNPVVAFCGDTFLNGGPLPDGQWYQEECDDERSRTCRTCRAASAAQPCRRVYDFAPARGNVTVVSTTGLAGVTFTLKDDAKLEGLVFEYVAAGEAATGTNVAIVIGATEVETARNTAAAVEGSTLDIDATASGSVVTLANQHTGKVGNAPIQVVPAAAPALVATGMAEGVGCALEDECAVDDDCVSRRCSSRRHVCINP